ncbi:hypothetical protein EVJ58_g8911 [Rhodofomes roseus]|uniref:Uncharacterized protein n=1 Tax=Rhodofomes roseus TaxID=34475 RepID=A0A4Y9XVT2_9APHY|nr:hypothetical protein EVJ58_g8911 [Rhodofomes roseus]
MAALCPATCPATSSDSGAQFSCSYTLRLDDFEQIEARQPGDPQSAVFTTGGPISSDMPSGSKRRKLRIEGPFSDTPLDVSPNNRQRFENFLRIIIDDGDNTEENVEAIHRGYYRNGAEGLPLEGPFSKTPLDVSEDGRRRFDEFLLGIAADAERSWEQVQKLHETYMNLHSVRLEAVRDAGVELPGLTEAALCWHGRASPDGDYSIYLEARGLHITREEATREKMPLTMSKSGIQRDASRATGPLHHDGESSDTPTIRTAVHLRSPDKLAGSSVERTHMPNNPDKIAATKCQLEQSDDELDCLSLAYALASKRENTSKPDKAAEEPTEPYPLSIYT